MTASEMELEFDVIYNDICSNRGPGLNKYEKSVFLTLGQEDILLSYLNPKKNKSGEVFDETRFKSLNLYDVTMNVTKPINTYIESNTPYEKTWFLGNLGANTSEFNEPFFILYEFVKGNDGEYYKVIPISSLEFNKVQSKPYRYPLKNTVWRVRAGGNYHIIGLDVKKPENYYKYTISLIRKPTPILIPGFYSESDMSIEGFGNSSDNAGKDCVLDVLIHHEIVQRAAELAKAAYEGNISAQIMLGQASKTQYGQIQGGN